MALDIRYARSGDVHIAYVVGGKGPPTIVHIPGYISHLELDWDNPTKQRVWERLAGFAQVIAFDKRGTGLSDPVPDEALPDLDQRMDDVRAVMDEVGVKRAVLFGASEGAMMSMLFAATYPERVEALILYGALARASYSEDHPWAPPREALIAGAELMEEYWGQGVTAEIFAPSIADSPASTDFARRYERSSASPSAAKKLHRMFLDLDVRDVVSAIHVPTLILHRTHDRVVNVRSARWLAEHISGARFVEFPGRDHSTWIGEPGPIVDEVQEFITGSREEVEPDRALRTVVFTDIVGSTERAAAMGDKAWRELLATHDAMVRHELKRFRGVEIKTLGDGFMACFEGPARAIRCALSAVHAAKDNGFDIRVGIHTGEVELIGEDIAGLSVHIAARVGALAGTGEVLVSRTVKDLVVGSSFTFDERGTHTLKGVPDEWQLYAVTG